MLFDEMLVVVVTDCSVQTMLGPDCCGLENDKRAHVLLLYPVLEVKYRSSNWCSHGLYVLMGQLLHETYVNLERCLDISQSTVNAVISCLGRLT